MKSCLTLCVLLCWTTVARAGDVTVAVASNLLGTVEELAAAFEAISDHNVLISHGSTGQLYSQIELGAPFDIYLAGDVERPVLLLGSGKATETRTYAFGHLSLVSKEEITVESAPDVLAGKTVALADPTVAPYGKAATLAMERLALDTATFRPVLVANVGQVASVFVTGNADAAFIAEAQVDDVNARFVLSLVGLIPEIRQDAAFLARASDNEAAKAFWDWLAEDTAAKIIGAAGYSLPGSG
ncbi:molybdate ABC transporter substrate-binding protein [Rhodobacteraceae bacterium]|nr:molybdate ABC transporter substrate-binding protein [Paracoccaceae bacterium]